MKKVAVSEVVKETGNTVIKFACATGGLTGGTIIANKIPVPAIGPLWLQTILQKAAPGVVVMILAWFSAWKWGGKGKDNYVDDAAIGAGLAGLVSIVKNFAPDLAKFIPLNGLGMVAPGGGATATRTIDMQQVEKSSYQMLNGIGMPANTYQVLN